MPTNEELAARLRALDAATRVNRHLIGAVGIAQAENIEQLRAIGEGIGRLVDGQKTILGLVAEPVRRDNARRTAAAVLPR